MKALNHPNIGQLIFNAFNTQCSTASVVYQFIGEIKFLYKNDVYIAVNLMTTFMFQLSRILDPITILTATNLSFITPS